MLVLGIQHMTQYDHLVLMKYLGVSPPGSTTSPRARMTNMLTEL